MVYPVPDIYDYTLVSRIGTMPVTAADLIAQLKLDPDLASDPEFVAYVDALVEAAVNCGEAYTKRTFVESNFNAYLDDFVSGCNYELRECPLQVVNSIEYYVDGSYSTFDSAKYYNTLSKSYAKIAVVDGESWPSPDTRLQSVVFDFDAGYKDGELPADLYQAVLMHVAGMFSNRGDCSFESSRSALTVTPAMPVQSRQIYQKWRILDLRLGL